MASSSAKSCSKTRTAPFHARNVPRNWSSCVARVPSKPVCVEAAASPLQYCAGMYGVECERRSGHSRGMLFGSHVHICGWASTLDNNIVNPISTGELQSDRTQRSPCLPSNDWLRFPIAARQKATLDVAFNVRFDSNPT
jgi:hypothetical protein